jgi:hypothetical protein
MTMYRRILAVVSVVLVVAGVGGFFMLKASAIGPSSWADRAQVTGYATSNVRGQTSGPVSVELDGASAARIDRIVERLPPANRAYICAENAQEYHISFTVDAVAGGGRQGFGLTGYGCNNLVVEVLPHGSTLDRIDRDCALFAEVRRLLPARAITTHAGTCEDANGRLFLAVSRHAAPRHRTATETARKTEARNTPVRLTPTRRSWRAGLGDARHRSADVKNAVPAPTVG